MHRKLRRNDGKIYVVEGIQSPEMRKFPMLQPDEKEKLERGFAGAEASLFFQE